MLLFVVQGLYLLSVGLMVQARAPSNSKVSNLLRPVVVEKMKNLDVLELIETSPALVQAMQVRGGANKRSVDAKVSFPSFHSNFTHIQVTRPHFSETKLSTQDDCEQSK